MRQITLIFLSFLILLPGNPFVSRAENSPAPLMGVILLPGKGEEAFGSNSRLSVLSHALEKAGYAVSTPDMPWDENHIYGTSFNESFKAIDRQVSLLKVKGIQKIILGGHSLGAHMALAYAGGHSGLTGLILLAPGSYPEKYGVSQKDVIESIRLAKRLLVEGKKEQVENFYDVKNGTVIQLHARADNYLSFCDPKGPGNMSKAVHDFQKSMPVLLISESHPQTDPKIYIYDHLRKNPKSLFLQSKSGHMETPQTSVNSVLNWLKAL